MSEKQEGYVLEESTSHGRNGYDFVYGIFRLIFSFIWKIIGPFVRSGAWCMRFWGMIVLSIVALTLIILVVFFAIDTIIGDGIIINSILR